MLLRKSLDSQVAAILRGYILSGRFSSGSRLIEAALAAELEVSRGPIRNALQRLRYEGLVVLRPYRGAFVRPLTPSDAWEIYTFRNTLEGMAARLVAERITPPKADALGEAFDRLVAAARDGDRQKVNEADYELHRLIVQLSGHSRLRGYYRLLEGQTRLYMTVTGGFHPNLAEVPELHKALVEAIRMGNAGVAEDLAKTHNTSDGEALVRRLGGLDNEGSSSWPSIIETWNDGRRTVRDESR